MKTHRGNEKLGRIGRKCRLGCGGHWIVGSDFAFDIQFAADGYDSPLSFVHEYSAEEPDWPKFIEMRLRGPDRNWFTLKSRDEVAESLGLEAAERSEE